MSATWEGLKELEQALLNLPAELVAEGTVIIEESADAAAAEIKGAYPVREGDLKDGVEVHKMRAGNFGAVATVFNFTKYASWFEDGTKVRHEDWRDTDRGSMPARPTFVPRVIAHRRRMHERLADMVRAHGLTVKVTP